MSAVRLWSWSALAILSAAAVALLAGAGWSATWQGMPATLVVVAALRASRYL